MVVIYLFSDENALPVYVGKTKNLKQRISEHLKDRFKYDTYFYRWLNKQIAFEKQYFIDVLETVPEELWIEKEKYWIKHIKDCNYQLKNMTDGGDGNNNQVFSKETIEKRRLKTIGQKRTEQQRQNISNALKGKKLSEETKRKLSKINKGKSCPEYIKVLFRLPIVQLDKTGKLIQKYNSVTDAANMNNWRKGSISNALNGNCKTFRGYIWKTQKEYYS